MRAARLFQTGLAGAALALTFGLSQAGAQSLLTYPGGLSTMQPPSAPPVAPPPAALTAPPAVAPAPAPVPAAAVPAAAAAAPEVEGPASTCDTDMMKLQEKRGKTMEIVNNAVKPNKKGQVDPLVACPNLRKLVSVETEMKNWMVKNQSWCNIPDQVMDQMKEGFGKTSEISDRACAAAAQMRKAQQQAQTGGPAGMRPQAPKLPSGPL